MEIDGIAAGNSPSGFHHCVFYLVWADARPTGICRLTDDGPRVIVALKTPVVLSLILRFHPIGLVK